MIKYETRTCHQMPIPTDFLVPVASLTRRCLAELYPKHQTPLTELKKHQSIPVASTPPHSPKSQMSDQHPPPPEPLVTNGPTEVPPPGPVAASAAAGPTTKRQRRPSVRLGDIGEQPAASDPYLHRRPPKHHPPSSSSVGPAIKNPNHRARVPNPDEGNLETLAASIRNPNPNPKFPKRNRNARSSWTYSKPEEGEEGDGFRSDSDDLPSETDAGGGGGGDWNDDNQNGDVGLDEDGGVRSWLNRLGLGRYAPVFEIHEVDDEVLPLLTLQDLKDMGINAVGSRRKMFCAIQKLQKNF